MKLQETTTFVLLGELRGFEVGKEIEENMIEFYLEREENQYEVSDAIQKVEFKSAKTYPISKVTENIAGVDSASDRFVEETGKSYPIFVACIEEGKELKYMYNDKSQLKYSNYYRKLDKNVEKWYIGYLKEEELAVKIPSLNQPKKDNSHILDIILEIESLKLNFRKTPNTVYDIAKLIQEGELTIDELDQSKLNSL